MSGAGMLLVRRIERPQRPVCRRPLPAHAQWEVRHTRGAPRVDLRAGPDASQKVETDRASRLSRAAAEESMRRRLLNLLTAVSLLLCFIVIEQWVRSYRGSDAVRIAGYELFGF